MIQMAEISFIQIGIDSIKDYIKKIDEQIEKLNRKKAKYQKKIRELET